MKHKRSLLNLTLVLSLFFGAFANAQPVYAATTWTVLNLADSGLGSLRESIANAAPGDTIQFNIGGTIMLTSGELHINKNLSIVGPGSTLLTINGSGTSRIFNTDPSYTISISGMKITNGYADPLGVDCSGGGIRNKAFLTLDDVVITANDSSHVDPGGCTYPRGGGIYSDNYGSLTITNSAISNNFTFYGGGGIYFNSNDGALSLTNVSVTGNTVTDSSDGGGIQYSAGNTQATLDNVTISNNSAPNGNAGGIDIKDDILITHSSITNNTSKSTGGGLTLRQTVTIVNSLVAGNTAGFGNTGGIGGGIWMGIDANVTLENSTVTGNTATSNGVNSGGGIYVWDIGAPSTLNINNSTIAKNKANVGGGIQIGANIANDVNISNSIIADNTSINGLTKTDCQGAFASENYNLIESVTNCTITGTTTHNMTGVDPDLFAALADNGGFTKTLALHNDSPAVDAGNDATCLGTDQRGVPRPRDAHCDIGAFEYGLIVSKLADTNDGACDVDCSLREALAASADGDIINFEAGLTGTITLDNLLGTLGINNSVTINGPGADKIAVSGNDQVKVFITSQNKTVKISSLTITHGYILNDSGGGIGNDGGDLTLDHVVVSNSQAVNSVNDGGGIFNYGTLTITNSQIINNTARMGGGIYNSATSTLSLTNTVVEHNSSTSGGGIYNAEGGILSLTDTIVDTNSVSASGGGLYLKNQGGYSNTVSLKRVSVTNNTAIVSGGGIFLADSATISDSLIANNRAGNGLASGSGGGIAIYDAGAPMAPLVIALTNVTISENEAYGQGGGIDAALQQAADQVTFNYVTIANNKHTAIPGPPPGNGGGGIYATGAEAMDIKNSIIAGNTSSLFTGVTTDCIGTINSLDHNLIQDTTNCTVNGVTTHNITGVSAKLEALANNGGATETMKLKFGSPAFDAADDSACPVADQRGIKRPQGSHCDMGAFESYQMAAPLSAAAKDGWTLESREFSNLASTKNNSSYLRVGDDKRNRQYRSLLYFDSKDIPDNADISKVIVKIKMANSAGIDPFTTHGNLVADIKKGFFGLSPLENIDFSAAGEKINTAGKFTLIPLPATDWYQLTLKPAHFKYINRAGATQFRLRFMLDDDNDSVADYINFYAGDAAPADQPELIVEYTLP